MVRRRSRGTAARRLPNGRRVVAAMISAIMAFFALRDSLANSAASAAPSQAQAIAPWNGRIAAMAAEELFRLAPTVDPRGKAATLARDALVKDATAADALNVLGLQADLQRDDDYARRVFRYSQRLSRRELPPRLAAIEKAVQRGDIDDALKNYDIALRTSKQAAAVLYPTLTAALTEPLVRTALVRVTTNNQAWVPDFINYASTSRAAEPRAVLQFILEAGDRLPVQPADRAALINNLVYAGALEEAWQYFSRLRVKERKNGIRDSKLAFPTSVLTVFDWRILEEAMVTPKENGGLAFAVPPTGSTILLQQMTLLPPRTHRVVTRFRSIDAEEGRAPAWHLVCRDGRKLLQLALDGGENPETTRVATRAGMATVPANCPVQTLMLVTPATDRIEGVSGEVISIATVSTEGI